MIGQFSFEGLVQIVDSFRVLSHQVEKSSISLVVEFSIIYDGKEQKKHQAYQGNDLFAKSSKTII